MRYDIHKSPALLYGAMPMANQGAHHRAQKLV